MERPILAIPYKIARKIYTISKPDSTFFGRNWKMFPLKQYSNNLIYDALIDNNPCMIARLGSTEMLCMTNYLGVHNQGKFKNYKSYVCGKTPPWWWEHSIINQMQILSGFFPGTVDKLEQFCELMLVDMHKVDILGSWLKEEQFFKNELSASKKIMLEDLEPFFTPDPWTKALRGKKVVVIHPFAETIQQQYLIREKLFDNNFLPDFDLKTIKAVQSIAGEKTSFTDWFEALNWMKAELEKIDFDICILGCGAYGFPLAAYIKDMGKKAIHLGGVTQLLFGIKGMRWENHFVYPYTNLYNEYWVRPSEQEKPKNAHSVEQACYW